MRRSTGITINAIVLLVASVAGFVALLVLLIQGIASIPKNPSAEDVAATMGYLFLAVVMGIPCWGFATGIGLLRLKKWARTCSVVTSALISLLIILSFIFFGAALVLSRDEPDRLTISTEAIVVIVAWVLAALYCGWWTYFFQTRAVKEQFGISEYVPAPPPAISLPAHPVIPVSQPPFPTTVPQRSARPASITIVAVFFSIGAIGTAMALPLYPIFHTPVPFFGFPPSGWAAPLVVLATGALGAAAAIGVFKLKLWARTLGIYFLAFGLLNTLVTLIRPGALARLEKSMEAMQLQFVPNQIGTEAFQATAQAMTRAWVHVLIPASLIIGAILAAVQIWLLITRKQAFINANQSSAANS